MIIQITAISAPSKRLAIVLIIGSVYNLGVGGEVIVMKIG
jgi:hypothetical protein